MPKAVTTVRYQNIQLCEIRTGVKTAEIIQKRKLNRACLFKIIVSMRCDLDFEEYQSVYESEENTTSTRIHTCVM